TAPPRRRAARDARAVLIGTDTDDHGSVRRTVGRPREATMTVKCVGCHLLFRLRTELEVHIRDEHLRPVGRTVITPGRLHHQAGRPSAPVTPPRPSRAA